MNYSKQEMMVVAAARQLADGDQVFVGVGLPNLAANLAKRLHAPRLQMIYEAGVVGANPARLPLSVGDPTLVTGAQLVCPMHTLFQYYLQAGRVDVGFLGAAQIDRWGNLNSTVIGSYQSPKVRMAGSGGACDIAVLARRTLILIPHQLRRFPAQVDFITSPGFPGGRSGRQALGLPGGGPQAVVTDLGLLGFDESGEMILTALCPGATREQVQEQTGWPLKVAPTLSEVDPPTAEELDCLRTVVDPRGIYLKSRDAL